MPIQNLIEDVYDTNDGQGEVRLDEQLYLLIVLRSSITVETAHIVLRKVLGDADVFQRVGTSREPRGIHKIDEIAPDLSCETAERRTVAIF